MRRATVGEDIGHRPLDRVEVDAEAGGEIRLGIHVDAQDAVALLRERARQVDRGRRLADAALLVRDRDHIRHGGITSMYDRPERRAVRNRVAAMVLPRSRLSGGDPTLSTVRASCSPNSVDSRRVASARSDAERRYHGPGPVPGHCPCAKTAKDGRCRRVDERDRYRATRGDARRVAARRGSRRESSASTPPAS